MDVTGGSRLRSGAIGFALAAAVAGVLKAISTVSLVLIVSRSLDAVAWAQPRWAGAAALVLLGVAGAVLWATPRAGRPAAVVAGVSALGVAGAAVWAVEPFALLAYGSTLRWLTSQALVVLLIAVVGIVWARTPAGPVRVVDAALGAVIALAATALPDLLELVSVLDRLPSGTQTVFTVMELVAGGLLVLAAVTALPALAGRVPVLPVAILTSLAGALLLVVAVRYATTLPDQLTYGGSRLQAAAILGVAVGFATALVQIALGVLLLRSGRAPRPTGAYGSADAAASWQTPAP